MTTKESKTNGAETALREFLEIASRPPAPGAGVPDSASPLLKNLWFSWNRLQVGFEWILKRRCKKLRQEMLLLLEWAMTEMYALSGLPPYACVSEAVEYAKRICGREKAGFVNAVLRGLLRDAPDAEALKGLLKDAPENVQCQLPKELHLRWAREFGRERTRELAEILQLPATATARRRGSLASLPYPLRFEDALALVETSTGKFPTGKYYLQDASTLLAPALLDPRPGETIADLCAAPGGKSLAIAERLQGQGRLICCDSAEPRMQRLKDNLKDVNVASVQLMDATRPTLEEASVDAILLDVPCSNTGVIRRRPDVRRNFSEANLRRLLDVQRRILEASARLVRPNGRIVYSTCSIENDENSLQIREFLKTHPEFSLKEEQQLYPTPEHDGAYAAALSRE